MKRVILLFGNPDNGKSFLFDKLTAKGIHCISVDHEYVAFVETTYPTLFFKEPGSYILQHHDFIFRLDQQRANEWHQSLWQKVQQASVQHDVVVVEGYLLQYCTDQFAAALIQASVEPILVRADGRTYVVETRRMTPEAFVDGLSQAIQQKDPHQ